MPEGVQDAILSWYGFLSSLSAQITPEIMGFDQRLGISFVTALLLGVLGATAPCQLTQSVGMLTILGRHDAGRPRLRAAVAYLAGKALVYTTLGAAAVALGAGLNEVSIPVFVMARKALGPMMIVIGLAMVGVLRFRWAPTAGLVARLRAVARQRAERAPMLPGVAFGFSFCPTLFALFFGILIPLSLARPDGFVYPAIFALGTALPLLLLLTVLSLGSGSVRRYVARFGRGQHVVAAVAGVVLVVTGLHDTVIYWLL